MRHLFKFIRLLCAAFVVAACSPARTGVIGSTLTTNVKPYISITGLAPANVLAHGRQWIRAATDSITVNATVAFDYAVFADSQPDHPSLSYAAIARIETPGRWHFLPSTDCAEAFSTHNAALDGLDFTVHVLRTPAAQDWASDMLRENNRAVPEYWLAQRWVAHLNSVTRAVLEYREPWPDSLPELSRGAVLIDEAAALRLREFMARADAAFLVERKAGTFTTGNAAPASLLAVPKTPPDVQKIMGGIVISAGGA